MSRFSRTLSGLLCGCLLWTSAGCTTLHIPFLKDRMPKASTRNPVAQIVCIWQPSEGRDPSGMPCRGFAGQILFLANRGSLPVQIEGDVRIYLFDDQGTPEEQVKPIHQYDFDSKSWAAHLTNGTLGPTYSVFVPYTRRDAFEANCALRVRLKTADGPAVFSDLAAIALEGRKKPKSETVEGIPTVEEAQAMTEAVSQGFRRTTTIPLDGKGSPPNVKGGGATGKAVAAQGHKPSGPVQLANYEEGAAANDPSAQRMEHLEQLVQEMRAQQAAQARGTARQPESSAPLRPLASDASQAERFQLTKQAVDEVQPATARPTRTATHRDEEEPTVEATSTTPTSRGKTLLRHPLSEFEDDAPSNSVRTAARAPRKPQSHHPLADLDDEPLREDSLTRPAERNRPQPVVRSRPDNVSPPTIIRATSEPSEERGWSDPFEPIDTGAIETSSLEGDATIHQRLRAAR